MTRQLYPLYPYDEQLMEQTRESQQSLFTVYRVPEKMIVLGRGSNADQEVRLDRADADNIPIYRRRGGGCTVVLDPGNVVVAFAKPQQGIADSGALIRDHADYIISGLHEMNFQGLARNGISDIVQTIGDQKRDERGKKISGSCVYRPKGLFFFSASLLVNADLSLIETYTKHPPREPAYRQGRSHDEFVTNLRLCNETAPSVDAFVTLLSSAVCHTSGYKSLPR